MFLKRVKVHAIRREQSTLVLETFCENFADFLEQESKSGCSIQYVLCRHYVIRIVVYGSTLIYRWQR